jgi:hypothetical protein
MKNIEEQILNAERIDLSGQDIVDICKGKTHIVPYHELNKYNSIDELLAPHGSVVLLYETRYDYGHWVCMFYDRNNEFNFFDSYGLKPDEELKYATYNLNEGRPFLTLLLNKYNGKIIVNNKRLQVFKNDVNTCGRWTAFRVLTRLKYTKNEFIQLFDTFKNNGDFYISAITYLETFS